MNPEPDPVESLFAVVLAKPAEERAAFLDQACSGDAALRQRVEALLKAEAEAGEGAFLTGPHQWATSAVMIAEGPGTRIGPYKLLQQIGEGGMGVVYMAEQEQPVRRRVALKIIKPGMDSAQVIARFEAERQALAMMDHQNIARVFDAGTTPSGRPYFVMELVHGIPITKFCDDHQLTPRQRLELFTPVCQAIQHAHQKGIIHRDVKPSNVLVTLYDDKPVPKVIDFGVAKAIEQRLTEKTMFTQFGALVGTFEYMSPEQAEMNAFGVDTRSDVYSLGVLLYELLTGTTPLERERLRRAALDEVVRLIRLEEAPRPSTRLSSSGNLPKIAAARKTEPGRLALLMRGELDWIVMRCLEKDRVRRYETASALARDVERYLHDEAVEACPPSAGYRLRKFVRRNKGRVVAAGLFAAMLFLVTGLIVYGVWWADRQSAERRHEQALIAARDNDAFKATLDRIEAALKSGRIAEAGALLDQAGRQIEELTPADLRERHERLDKDEKTVRELDDIFEERWMISRSDTRLDNSRAKGRYPALFQQYDLAVGTEPAAQSVEKIRRSLIADALSSSMAEWFFVDPKYPGLLAVVDLLDPDPGRATLRAAIANGDDARVKEIGKTIDGSRLAPAYAVGLGTHPAVEDGMRILKAAWTTHPDSFALTLSICSGLCTPNEKLIIEAVGWGRAAIALRPNNPLSHYYLAIALGGFGGGDNGHAVEELGRAIQLAPRFARAYGQLALILHHDENPEALAVARKAIELDSESHLGHVVILMELLAKKDYIGAAKVYRQIAGLKEEEWQLQNESWEYGFTAGVMFGAMERILDGLMQAGRPFEAYRLYIECSQGGSVSDNGHWEVTLLYEPASAAVLAGTGQGLDAPPPAERPAIRKRALEWLTSGFDVWKDHATAFPGLAASSVGLIGSPFGQGPLLAASALSSGRPDVSAERARDREVVHERMNQWLSDADLVGVRDDQWLAKLPADEREQWRKLWSEVRSLRERTAPAKAAP